MSCGTNGTTGKQLKFIDNKLAIIFGSSTVAGISFCKFMEDVIEYKYGELSLVHGTSNILIDTPNTYKTIVLKATYPSTFTIDSSFLAYKTNMWEYNSGDNTFTSNTTGDYNLFHEFIIINSNTLHNISYLELKNTLEGDVTVEYLFTK